MDDGGRKHLLVEYAGDLSPYELGRVISAIALIQGIKRVFDADVTGLPADRLAVIMGVPTAAAVQRPVRPKVSLGG